MERTYYKQDACAGVLSEVERRWGVKRGAKVVKVGVKQGVKDGRVPKGVKGQSTSIIYTMLVLGC